jgi:hypothetical protein
MRGTIWMDQNDNSRAGKILRLEPCAPGAHCRSLMCLLPSEHALLPDILLNFPKWLFALRATAYLQPFAGTAALR